MMIKTRHTGLTLIEIVVAVAIIAILAAGLYSVSNYLQKQSQINLTQSTIDTLVAALEQYHDFSGSFPLQDSNQADVRAVTGSSLIVDEAGNTLNPPDDYNNLYASSEGLYYILNRIPASKKILDSINHSLITNKDYKGTEYYYRIVPTDYPLIHIIDSWKSPFRYTYSQGNNFPLIESAGPDKDFNKTADNLSSR